MTDIAILGAGPAGLIAADALSADPALRNITITIYDRMRRPGRKFLLAGRGGLNLTHSEPLDRLLTRYPETSATAQVRNAISAYPPNALVSFAEGLGIETFIGTSGRVFPTALKASPMLRAWLARLGERGVQLETEHRWTGWDDAGGLQFDTPQGAKTIRADLTLLALGGASWPKLGSDGAWREPLGRGGIATSPLVASNCGALIEWTPHYRERFNGGAIKRVAMRANDASPWVRGDLVVTRTGLEGSPIYAIGPELRVALGDGGPASVELDLRPDLTPDDLGARLVSGKAKDSLTNTLRKRGGLQPAAINMLRETMRDLPRDPAALALLVKSVTLPVTGLANLDRAISSAGGVIGDALADDFSLQARPDTFVAGEMIDWDAPTGGYLLQACLATGVAAARGMIARIRETS